MRIVAFVISAAACQYLLCDLCPPAFGAESEKWQGVDESVVNRIAKEHGREARDPYINTDQGDLLLFVFLLAGTVGGFAAGYSWRKLMAEKTPKVVIEEQAAADGLPGRSGAQGVRAD